MEFRVLGPLEVLRDGVVTPVPGRIGVQLLAMLLLDPGRTVPMHRLVEGIWDGDPPATATAQVRNAASRLRRSLGDDRVVFGAGGYRINPQGVTVDATRFADAVRQARGLLADDDRAGALNQWRSALKLWRGNAFEGLSGRIIEAGAAHLDETRWAAVEDRIDLELDLGDPSQVIGELKRLVLDQPYRQRLASQLMLALYRAGRTPEALTIYEELRARLADDLGLDPDVRLTQRHAAILRDDPSLIPRGFAPEPERPGEPAPARGPAQLPALAGRFIGRAGDLSALSRHLADTARARSAVIAGPAGAGKTALAVCWAHQVRNEFPDGQLFVNLRGFDPGQPVQTQEALGGFVHALQPQGTAVPSDLEEATGLYRSLTQDKRILVVLDNVRDAAQVRRLLPAGAGCFALVTSRHKLTGLSAVDGAGHFGLERLARSESVELLAQGAGTRTLPGDSDAAHRLAELCGDLPLALRIAAAHLSIQTNLSIRDYTAQLEADPLDILTVDGDPDATVKTALDQSFLVLDNDDQDLFCRLGLIPGDDIPEDLALAVGPDPTTVKRGLRRLASAHLLEQHHPGRYRFHDLVREYGKERAARSLDAADRETITERVIDRYHRRRFDRLTVDHGNLVATIEAWQGHHALWKLLLALTLLGATGTDVSMVKRCVDAEIELARARDDVPALQALYRCKAQMRGDAGDYPAELEYSRKAVTLGPDATGYYTYCLGEALNNNGEREEAEESLAEAMRLARECGNEYTFASSGRFLGHLHRVSGQFAEAKAVLSDVLAHSTVACPVSVLTTVKLILARVHFETGEVSTAREMLQPLLSEPDQLSPNGHRTALFLRSEIHISTGDFTQALDDLRASRDVNSFGSEIVVNTELRIISVRCDMGDYRKALERIEEIAPQVGPNLVPRRDHTLARIHNGLGNFAAALDAAERAADGFAEFLNALLQARALVTAAEAHDGLGQHESARDVRRQALAIFTRLGAPEADELSRSLDAVR